MISFFEATYQGTRASNQDCYAHLIEKEWSLFIVTDGLGGMPRGEVASTEFCHACVTCAPFYARMIQINPLPTITEFIQAAVKQMQNNIHQQYGALNTHTVFALVWITPQHIITAHIGDVRIYRLNKINQWRTPDHTYVQQLFEQGVIEEKDFATHPLQNRLIKTLNTVEISTPEIFIQPKLTHSDTLIICSDGFWTQLDKNDLCNLSETTNLQETIEMKVANILSTLIESDNITVQAIRMV